MEQTILLSALTPDPGNSRRHPEENVALIAEALAEVGASRSVVIDEAGRVLAGNATLEAARRVGLSSVRVVDGDGRMLIAVRRTGLTEEQKTRLALWDNRAAELAAWDGDVLAALLEEGADLSPLWTESAIAALLNSEALTHDLSEPAPFGKVYGGQVRLGRAGAGEAVSDPGEGPADQGPVTNADQGPVTNDARPIREASPPAEFPVYDETLPTQYRCPRCAYCWSGQPK